MQPRIQTINLELLRPTRVKQRLFRKMSRQVGYAKNTIMHRLADGDRVRSSSAEVDAALPSAVKNQVVRDTKSTWSEFKTQQKKLATRKRHKKRSKKRPQFTPLQPIPFNNQNWSIESVGEGLYQVAFPVVRFGKTERIRLPIRLYGPQVDAVSRIVSGEHKRGLARLVRKAGKWYFQVSYTFAVEAKDMSTRIMGIDLGLKYPAVVSWGKRSRFYLGKQVGFVRRWHSSKRRELQSQGHWDQLVTMRARESEYMRQVNHRISKEIVTLAEQARISVIAMEDLKDIRQSIRSKHAKSDRNINWWSFHELQQFITYKAEAKGIRVVKVDPAYTSQTCNGCGCINKSNRNGIHYHCSDCGHRIHSDLNAARNIAERALARDELATVA